MKVGSLFSGIGGIDLGFALAGAETRWMCEIDKNCQSVLRRHAPNIPVHGDITTLDPDDLEDVDVIAFGSPCQDLSVAGRRAGLAGQRSSLFYHALRIILAKRPSFVLWENVPGALTSNGGRDFGAVLDSLANIGALDIGWRVFDAQWGGVPQRRRRVFLVADFGSRRAGQILPLAEGSPRDTPAWSEQRGQVARVLVSHAGTEELRAAYAMSICNDSRANADIDVASPLRGGDRSQSSVAWPCYWDGGQVSDTLDVSALVKGQMMPEKRRFPVVVHPILEVNGRQGPAAADARAGLGVGKDDDPMYTLQAGKQHGIAIGFGTKDDGSDSGLVAPTLRSMGHQTSHPNGGGQGAVAYRKSARAQSADGYETWVESDVTNTVNTFDYGDIRSTTVLAQEEPEFVLRRLMPIECERLMGLPDDWTRWGHDGKEMADSVRYRMIGNSVAVPDIQWIAERMLRAFV